MNIKIPDELLQNSKIIALTEDSQKIEIIIEPANPAHFFKKKIESNIRDFFHKNNITKNVVIEFRTKTQEDQKLKTSETSPSNVKSEQSPLKNVKVIIGIGSGKGGVGKSTVTVNLSTTFALRGFSVGLIDADIYGPSIPLMLGVKGMQPSVKKRDNLELIEPLLAYGIKVISLGLFAKDDQPIPWRGPMASNAIKQLFYEVDWGELDFLFVDIPPGTGDVHLTLAQQIKLSGAIVVTTPQEVAMLDVLKAIKMFEMRHIEVPVLGIIENYSYFSPTDAPEKKYYLFGRDGGKKLSELTGIPLLGQIPFFEEIVSMSDNGAPVHTSQDPRLIQPYENIADKLLEVLKERNLFP